MMMVIKYSYDQIISPNVIVCIFAEIENITQQIVIRLIKRENRIMSKNMDDASEKCVKLGAIFEEKCDKCQA